MARASGKAPHNELRSEPPSEFRGPVVRLRRTTDRWLHPWVYRRMIRKVSPVARDGAEVLVVSADGKALGRGLYHGRSTIAVRILSRDPDRALDEEFFRERLDRAIALRRDVLGLERATDAYRVVHAEGDGLSGLVVDRYGDLLVVEPFSRGIFQRRALIGDLLRERFPASTVVFKVDALAGEREGMSLPLDEASAPASVGETEIREGKARFTVSPAGHKTGFFLDQRENRQRLAAMVRGLRVLDAFAYTGAFAVAARTLGKARSVTAVELDEDSIVRGRQNARLNRAEIEWVHDDAFRYLRRQRHAVEPFDVICLDPPKWAADRAGLEEAERRYVDINLHALRALRRGGVLVTCCCSGLVGEGVFLRCLARAAERAERRLQIVHIGGAAADHPVDVHCPESRYLTAVFARAL